MRTRVVASDASGGTGAGIVGTVRDVRQNVGAITIASLSSNGTNSTCTGTYAGGQISANCTSVSADSKCTASYQMSATVSDSSWNLSPFSYEWSGAGCGSAGMVVTF